MTLAEILRSAPSEAFWRPLAPELHIDEPLPRSLPAPAETSAERARMLSAGWAKLERVLPRDECDALAGALVKLHHASIPTPFLYVFDEAWSVAARLAETFEALLGSRARVLPDIWAWHIVSGEGARGWAPHRGVYELDAGFWNTWIALSDVSEASACMHVVPLDRDPHYPNALDRVDVDPAIATPLPVPAGSLLAWNANVLHWGGEMKPGAPPRASLSFTLRAIETQGDFAPGAPPKFSERVDLVADMLLTYREASNTTGPWLDWANAWSGMRDARRR